MDGIRGRFAHLPRQVDPLLADRITEAVLLSGLPVAFGGQGPGVHLCPADPLDDDDRCDGLIALHWRSSRRLSDAAAMERPQQPAFAARQTVTASMETALAEFLPAFGLDARRDRLGWELRVGGTRGSGVHVPPDVLVRRPPGRTPAELGLGPEAVGAVRRSAALAGLPVAGHLGAPGVTLGPCPPSGDEDDTAGVVDLGWNPARRLSDLADSRSPAAGSATAARSAVHAAMSHALGTVLGVCGTDLGWVRPQGRERRLRAYGASAAPAIRR
ncbi:hypothetical protein [Kitasatospora sp. NPDC088351]|uniref:hypothetical protein n=1 Tax=unclassified Kitasatospora TaxID=2633591 RepID=UPI00342F75F7